MVLSGRKNVVFLKHNGSLMGHFNTLENLEAIPKSTVSSDDRAFLYLTQNS